MKKSILLALLGLGILAFGFILFGCGTAASGGGTVVTTTTTTSTTVGSNVTLSGQLSSGTISGFNVQASAALSGYSVVAVNHATGQTYFGATDSSGNFSVTAPAGASYEVALLDFNSRFAAPVVMVGDSSSSEVVMGITPTTDTSFGQIVLDPSSDMAMPTTEPSIANHGATARASGGVPLGAGNYGKGSGADASTTVEGTDMDQDGIPNVFDADEDGDGIRNGILSTPSYATVTSSTIETVNFSSNIWHAHGPALTPWTEIMMRISVIPKTGKDTLISSVMVVDVPASIKDTAYVWDADSLGTTLESYPAERTIWQTVSYKMYKRQISGAPQWVILLIPGALPHVGDVFRIRVTYADGSTEDFFTSISYVLTDIPLLLTYTDIAGTQAMPSTLGAASMPVTFEGNTLEVVFSKAKDEDDNVMDGLIYSLILGYVTADANVPNDRTEYRDVTTSDATSCSYSLTSSELVDARGAYPVLKYYITPVAETGGTSGQRNGEETWFSK